MHFPYDFFTREFSIYYTRGWESNGNRTHTEETICKLISKAFLIRWVLLPFPMLWEIDEKTDAFPIPWKIQQDVSLMEKKHPYYRDCVRANFPGFSCLMGFAAFFDAMGHWWENPCISHMKKSNIGWESNGKKAPIL